MRKGFFNARIVKYLIVGLGNIGYEYVNTRHNIGFDILDYLAEEKQAKFELDRHAYKASLKHKGRAFHLIKPTTYMNLSGKAVNYWIQKLQIPLENVLIVVDDLNLPLGTLRLRAKGSAGGHNGLENIQFILNTNKWPRLRFGIGDDFGRGRQVSFVLGHWENEEKELKDQLIEKAAKAILSFGTSGIAQTMTQFN